jgi:hypothetical protein
VITHPFNRPILEAYDEERDQRLAFYADLLRASGVPGDLCAMIDLARRNIGDYAVCCATLAPIRSSSRPRLVMLSGSNRL